MDTASFFTKWLKDMEADQDSGGTIPIVITMMKEAYVYDENYPRKIK